MHGPSGRVRRGRELNAVGGSDNVILEIARFVGTRPNESAEGCQCRGMVRTRFVGRGVASVEAVRERSQLAIDLRGLPQDRRHVLVEGDVLELRDDDAARLQEELRVVPVHVRHRQPLRHAIMLAQENLMQQAERVSIGLIAQFAGV